MVMLKIPQLALMLLMFVSSVTYFKYQRPAQSPQPGQHYIAVDETIWQHARPDLGDLRLYNGQAEIPYALITERGGTEHEHKAVPVFQQATVGGKTQFLIDMRELAEYDHVDLKLSTKNFVAHARVEGQDDLHAAQWAGLGDSILYDLSRENLGSNSMLRLPRASYKYLRVTLDGPVKPEDVTGASSERREEQKPVWRNVGSEPSSGSTDARAMRWEKGRLQPQSGNDTVLTFTVPENVPVEKIVFDIDPAQSNFRRAVQIHDNKGQMIGVGDIARVHMVRAGQKIDSEDPDVDFSETGEKTLAVVILNGDDPPLKLRGAHLQQQERRIYFDAPASASLTLYYGDEKLDQPVYDYAKFFQRQSAATAAQLGAETENGAYTGRPDQRPWSDRHPLVLWIAIIVAVLGLGALALRSMRTAAA